MAEKKKPTLRGFRSWYPLEGGFHFFFSRPGAGLTNRVHIRHSVTRGPLLQDPRKSESNSSLQPSTAGCKKQGLFIPTKRSSNNLLDISAMAQALKTLGLLAVASAFQKISGTSSGVQAPLALDSEWPKMFCCPLWKNITGTVYHISPPGPASGFTCK